MMDEAVIRQLETDVLNLQHLAREYGHAWPLRTLYPEDRRRKHQLLCQARDRVRRHLDHLVAIQTITPADSGVLNHWMTVAVTQAFSPHHVTWCQDAHPVVRAVRRRLRWRSWCQRWRSRRR